MVKESLYLVTKARYLAVLVGVTVGTAFQVYRASIKTKNTPLIAILPAFRSRKKGRQKNPYSWSWWWRWIGGKGSYQSATEAEVWQVFLESSHFFKPTEASPSDKQASTIKWWALKTNGCSVRRCTYRNANKGHGICLVACDLLK